MTEADWLTSADVGAMLTHLTRPDYAEWAGQRRVSDRKLRLFACACCRAVWPLLTDERSRRAVEVAERHTDGEATEAELHAAFVASCRVDLTPPKSPGRAAQLAAQLAARWASMRDEESERVLHWSRMAGTPPATQAALLRDIIGNPFRPVDRSEILDVGTRAACVAKALAETIYRDRDFAALPVLWDALSEAGCQDEAIEAHCREPLHARGCWALDLVLGKE